VLVGEGATVVVVESGVDVGAGAGAGADVGADVGVVGSSRTILFCPALVSQSADTVVVVVVVVVVGVVLESGGREPSRYPFFTCSVLMRHKRIAIVNK
jgi:hypothetical protein